uniref:Uncharacterized protein n=1 Tax=Setaria italica TaxID=4555 RepID=K3Z1K3_SETIT
MKKQSYLLCNVLKSNRDDQHLGILSGSTQKAHICFVIQSKT